MVGYKLIRRKFGCKKLGKLPAKLFPSPVAAVLNRMSAWPNITAAAVSA
jgi:hypothetical protein